MDKRQKQETLILKLLKHSPEQASWLDPDQMDQAKLDEYEHRIWNGIKNKSTIHIGIPDNMFDTKVFRIIATLPQNVKLEKLDEFRKNGFTVQFVPPCIRCGRNFRQRRRINGKNDNCGLRADQIRKDFK